MANEILRLLIENACKNGEISDLDREIILKKASQLGISDAEVEKMIQDELSKVQGGMESGFIPMDDLPLHNNQNKNINQSTSKFTDLQPLNYQGAMSVVYQAKMHGKWIIIKRIKEQYKNDPKYRELFIREFENAYHLDHPNIVRLLDKGEDAEGLFYTMEYIDGRPLSDMITENGLKNQALAKKIAKQILDALSYVHKKQIFHRDLKPDNIYVTYRGDNVKILDFGLAAADYFDDNLAKAGTPRYAAPEQLSQAANIDQRADLFSFGKIFQEMLTGSVDETDIEKIENKTYRYIVQKCVAQNPNDRFNDAEEILSIFANPNLVPKTKTKKTGKKQKEPKTSSTSNSKAGIVILAVIVLLAVVAGLYFAFFNKKAEGGGQKILPKKKKSEFVAKADSLYNVGEYSKADSVYKLINKKDEHINNRVTELDPLVAKIKEADKIFAGKNIARALKMYSDLKKQYPVSAELSRKVAKSERIIKNADFKKLKAVYGSGENKYGVADENGNIVIDYQFDKVFDNYYMKNAIGLMPVQIGRKYGFISRSKDIVPCEYDTKPAAFNMRGKGYYYVSNKNRRKYYLFVDSDGKPVIETR